MSENTMSRILVAIDGSDASMKAAGVAIATAKKDDTELFIVTALELPPYGLSNKETEDHIKSVKKKAGDETEKWFDDIKQRAKEKGIKIQTEMIEAVPNVVSSIIHYADHNKIDLIVVGSTGKTGFKRVLLGSVASDMVKYSTCPVMVVK